MLRNTSVISISLPPEVAKILEDISKKFFTENKISKDRVWFTIDNIFHVTTTIHTTPVMTHFL